MWEEEEENKEEKDEDLEIGSDFFVWGTVTLF